MVSTYSAAFGNQPMGQGPGMAAAPTTGGGGTDLTGILGGLTNIAHRFTANFAKDPAIRQQYQQQVGMDAETAEAKKREVFASTLQVIKEWTELAKANPTALARGTPARAEFDKSIQAVTEAAVLNGADPAIVGNLVSVAQAYADNPPVTEAMKPEYVNVQLSDGSRRMVNINDPAATAALPPDTVLAEKAGDATIDKILAPVFQNMVEGKPLTDGQLKLLQMWQNRGSTSVEVNVGQGEKEAESAGQTAAKANVVLNAIAVTREKVQNADWWNPTTGLGGQALKNIGGTAANDVRAMVQTIKANIGFDRLQAMRQDPANKTGGALGNITVEEIEFLQATLGNLEQSQTKEQFLLNLNQVESIYNQILAKAAATAAAFPESKAFAEFAVPTVPGRTGGGGTVEWKIENGELVPVK